jgi:hypothetical protein
MLSFNDVLKELDLSFNPAVSEQAGRDLETAVTMNGTLDRLILKGNAFGSAKTAIKKMVQHKSRKGISQLGELSFPRTMPLPMLSDGEEAGASGESGDKPNGGVAELLHEQVRARCALLEA